MTERGLSQIRANQKENHEQLTARKTHKQELPNLPTIIASGYSFIHVEDIPYADIPGATFHFYEEIGQNKNNVHVKIIEIGLNDPGPIPLRIDHGCPCMDFPLAGHDCAQQRDLAMQAMQQIGRGMMVQVNAEASASMGHGVFHVMKNQKIYQEALRSRIQQLPTLVGYLQQEGIEEFDVRKHPEVASLIARRLETIGYDKEHNPIILLGSSPAKINSLQNGHNIQIADTARVIVADRTDRSKAEMGYGTDEEVTESGVYLEVNSPDDRTMLVPFTDIFPSYMDAIFSPRILKQKGEIIYDITRKN